MKKSKVKPTKLPKLALRGEVIVLLAPAQLGEVRGGDWTWFWPCDGGSNQKAACTTTTGP
jgi:hypothetical protein